METLLKWALEALSSKTVIECLMDVLKKIAADTSNDFDDKAYCIIEGVLIQYNLIDNPKNINGIKESVTGAVAIADELLKNSKLQWPEGVLKAIELILNKLNLYDLPPAPPAPVTK